MASNGLIICHVSYYLHLVMTETGIWVVQQLVIGGQIQGITHSSGVVGILNVNNVVEYIGS